MTDIRGPDPLAQLPSFTLRQLAYLVAAADAGTVAGGAEKMFVSPSTMSDAITDLEKSLGTRLCVRRKAQGLSLTSAGERAVAEARKLIRDAQELHRGLSGRSQELAGPVAVGCFPTLAPTVLPPLLSAFVESHPKLEVSVHEAAQDELAQLLDSGRVDMAFVYDVQLPRAVRRAPLFALPPHIVLPATHRLAAEPYIRLEDLAEEDFIMLDSPPSSIHTLALFASRGVNPRIRHRTSNPDVVRTLVGRGLGYGMLIQRHLDLSQDPGYPLVRKDIIPAVKPLAVDAVWSAAMEPTARTRAVIDFARAVQWPQIEPVPTQGPDSAEFPQGSQPAMPHQPATSHQIRRSP